MSRPQHCWPRLTPNSVQLTGRRAPPGCRPAAAWARRAAGPPACRSSPGCGVWIGARAGRGAVLHLSLAYQSLEGKSEATPKCPAPYLQAAGAPAEGQQPRLPYLAPRYRKSRLPSGSCCAAAAAGSGKTTARSEQGLIATGYWPCSAEAALIHQESRAILGQAADPTKPAMICAYLSLPPRAPARPLSAVPRCRRWGR